MWVSVMQLHEAVRSFYKETHIILWEPGLEGALLQNPGVHVNQEGWQGMGRRVEAIFCFHGIARRPGFIAGSMPCFLMLLNTRLIQVLFLFSTFWYTLCVRSFISLKISMFSLCLCSCRDLTSDGSSALPSCLFTPPSGMGRGESEE